MFQMNRKSANKIPQATTAKPMKRMDPLLLCLDGSLDSRV